MKVLIVKDGTIPVGVCRLLYEDHLAVAGDVVVDGHEQHDLLEVFEVEDNAEALFITWSEMGFECSGQTYAEGLRLLQNPDDNPEPVIDVSPGHLAVTYNPGDNEGYGHLFDLRRLA